MEYLQTQGSKSRKMTAEQCQALAAPHPAHTHTFLLLLPRIVGDTSVGQIRIQCLL